MLKNQPFVAKITVEFEKRDDGGLRASSPDIPGFYLSNSDPEIVLADVVPALQILLKANYGLDASVQRLDEARYILREFDSRTSDSIPGRQEYLVQKQKAA